MRRWTHLVAVMAASMLVGGCVVGSSKAGDAAQSDVLPTDGAGADQRGDVAADAVPADGGRDSVVADGTADVGADAGIDDAAPDSSVDSAAPDSSVDSAVDDASVDGSVDSAVGDSNVDSSVDSGPVDVSSDRPAADSTVDSGPPDSSVDSTIGPCGGGFNAVGMFATWCGKVNVHSEPAGWVVDSDCTSGCGVNGASYCQKFWPGASKRVEVAPDATLKPFATAGCASTNPHRGKKQFVWFRAVDDGKYDIVCAELCGWGHYKMGARVVALAEEEFESAMEALETEQRDDGFPDDGETDDE